ncbi:hypothetical protein R3P38DRAFT_3245764 [Favolaschia claudopus]|uniref:Zn(2)-C6 fungal-type domain-containing protein n=1 Tax=Favolaschia claudopus TaxID=2862362 RepID=A0AAV9Z006_9AGAR
MSDLPIQNPDLFNLFTKRRRAFIACKNCRRRKVKCISSDYHPCRRCTVKGLKCEYYATEEELSSSSPSSLIQEIEIPENPPWASQPITPPSAGLSFSSDESTSPSEPSTSPRFPMPPTSSKYRRRERAPSTPATSDVWRYRAHLSPGTPIPRLSQPIVPRPAYTSSSAHSHHDIPSHSTPNPEYSHSQNQYYMHPTASESYSGYPRDPDSSYTSSGAPPFQQHTSTGVWYRNTSAKFCV